jgi:hypothetical protein
MMPEYGGKKPGLIVGFFIPIFRLNTLLHCQFD